MVFRNHPRSTVVLLAGVILLLVAASRMLRLDELKMNQDEIWAVWQTLGSPAQIIRWTPYDWPPLYYLLLGAWRGLTGLHPIILRYSSVLIFLLGSAFLYRSARRLAGERAAILTVLGYAALGYATLLSLEVRGYASMMGLMPAIGAFFILGVYTLVVYRRAVWRWWQPGLLAVALALPEIVSKARYIDRTAATTQLATPALPEALYNLFWQWTGYPFIVWVILFVAGVAVLVVSRQIARPVTMALLLWVLASPILLYVLNPLLGFFSARYAWWIMPGIALLVGIGLSRLPRMAGLVAGIALTGMMLSAPPLNQYNIFENLSELGINFTWLQKRLLPSDVLLADPSNRCGRPEEWDYYTRTYFPNGLTFVDNPVDYRRVWYVFFDGQQDRQLQATVSAGRMTGEFIGPPGCQFRLYEAPPDAEGILFENGMRFHGADVIENGLPWSGPLVRHEGEPVRLRLWWSADRPVNLDFSVGVYLLSHSGTPVASADSAPQVIYPFDAPGETSQWTPDTLYVEEREVSLPFPTPRTSYTISLAVYFWQDGKRIAAPGVDESGLLRLRRVTVMSY
jgi:hypothetical protein